MKAKRVVLIGAQDQDKTTFFNSITKQTQKTQYYGQSCTRQIVQANTEYGQGFEIIDTPGFNSSEHKLLHVAGILAALTLGEVNRILIVTKYDRDDFIINNLELVFRPINRYRQIVTIILSHWDCCVIGKEKQEQIRIKELIDKKFKIQSILFFPKIITQKLFAWNQNKSCLAIINKQKYQQIIQKYFLIFNYQSQIVKMRIYQVHIKQKYQQNLEKSVIQQTNPLFVNILSEITIKLKFEANMIVEEFEKQCGEEITKIVDKHNNKLHYLHYIEMKKQI